MPDFDDIKYVAKGGLNYDDSQLVFPPEDYRYALNCIQDEGGEYGAITNIKGNQLVTVTLPVGTNTVIGYCEDQELRALIWFVCNSADHHCIVRYKIEQNLVEFILYDESILNFDINHRINNAGIVGSGYRKMLFWTDDYNPPRKLNIAMAKGFTVCSSTSTTSTYTTTTNTTSTTSSTSTSTTRTTTTSTSTTTTAGWCAEYDAVHTNFVNKPPHIIAEAFNEMVEEIVACGAWATCDVFDFFATHVNTAGEALVNWANPGTCDPSELNGPTWVQFEGYTGDETAHALVRTNYIPWFDGVHYTLNSASIMLGCGLDSDGPIYDMGGSDASYTNTIITRNGTVMLMFINEGYVIDNYAVSSLGYFAIIKNGVSSVHGWHDMKYYTGAMSVSPQGVPTVEMYACGWNGNGAPNGSEKPLRFIWMGGALTNTQYKIVVRAIEKCLDFLSTGIANFTTSTTSTTTTGYDYRVKT